MFCLQNILQKNYFGLAVRPNWARQHIYFWGSIKALFGYSFISRLPFNAVREARQTCSLANTVHPLLITPESLFISSTFEQGGGGNASPLKTTDGRLYYPPGQTDVTSGVTHFIYLTVFISEGKRKN